ncbi:unnamed protein product, partial [Ixodes pacificus]
PGCGRTVRSSCCPGWWSRSTRGGQTDPPPPPGTCPCSPAGRGRRRASQGQTPPHKARSPNSPYLVIASVRVRKLMDTRRLKAQLMEVAREKQVERAHSG